MWTIINFRYHIIFYRKPSPIYVSTVLLNIWGFPLWAVRNDISKNILLDHFPVLLCLPEPQFLLLLNDDNLGQAWCRRVVFGSGCSLELMTYEL